MLIQEQEHEQAREHERRSLAQAQLSSRSLSSSPHFGFSLDETKVSDGVKEYITCLLIKFQYILSIV